jgi:hypothetical protein
MARFDVWARGVCCYGICFGPVTYTVQYDLAMMKKLFLYYSYNVVVAFSVHRFFSRIFTYFPCPLPSLSSPIFVDVNWPLRTSAMHLYFRANIAISTSAKPRSQPSPPFTILPRRSPNKIKACLYTSKRRDH